MAMSAQTGSDASIFDELANFGMKYHHALAELIDNAVSAADTNKIKPIEIEVSLRRLKSGNVKACVKDSSGGIPERVILDKLFKIAGKTKGGTYLNEHGMGFLNVISMAEDHGCAWSIKTATDKSRAKSKAFFAESPYAKTGSQSIDDVPFKSYGRVGTTVCFEVPMDYAGTVSEGKSGANPSTIDTIAAQLREHFGVLYRPRLEAGELNLTIRANSKFIVGAKSYSLVEQVMKLKNFNISIPGMKGHHLKVSGSIGLIPEKVNTQDYYYAGTASSRGVDVRFGDRIIASQVIYDIWGRKGHSTLNRLAGEIHIKANKKGTPYPKTRPDKSGIKPHDKLWRSICKQITAQIPGKSLPQWTAKSKVKGKTEAELQDELKSHLEAPAGKFGDKKKYDVQVNTPVDATSHIAADLVVMPKGKVQSIPLVIECKRDESKPLDVYQLIMYWHSINSCVKASNGKGMYDVSEGWLVASKHSTGTKNLITRINKMNYPINGKSKTFTIQLYTWSDFGITLT